MVIGRTVTAQERGHIRHKHSQSPSLNLRLKHRLQFHGTLHQTCQCKPSSSMSVLHQLHKQVLAQPKLQLTSWNKPWLMTKAGQEHLLHPDRSSDAILLAKTVKKKCGNTAHTD